MQLLDNMIRNTNGNNYEGLELNRILFSVGGFTFLLMSLGKRHLSIIL